MSSRVQPYINVGVFLNSIQIDHDLYRLDLPNLGLLMTEIPDDMFNSLKQMALNKLQDSSSPPIRLCAHIDNEYEFNEAIDLLDPIINRMSEQYGRVFLHAGFDQIPPNVRFKYDCWINYQYKTEFNPLHNHSGMLSYILWIDIPYDEQAELHASPGQPNGSVAGQVGVCYSDILGSHQIHYFKNQDIIGKLIFFPAPLLHMVYPFYSTDKPRISIAGNVVME